MRLRHVIWLVVGGIALTTTLACFDFRTGKLSSAGDGEVEMLLLAVMLVMCIGHLAEGIVDLIWWLRRPRPILPPPVLPAWIRVLRAARVLLAVACCAGMLVPAYRGRPDIALAVFVAGVPVVVALGYAVARSAKRHVQGGTETG